MSFKYNLTPLRDFMCSSRWDARLNACFAWRVSHFIFAGCDAPKSGDTDCYWQWRRQGGGQIPPNYPPPPFCPPLKKKLLVTKSD
jgi:hypothetical protein